MPSDLNFDEFCQACGTSVIERIGIQIHGSIGSTRDYHNVRCPACGAGGTLVFAVAGDEELARAGPAVTSTDSTDRAPVREPTDVAVITEPNP